MCRSVRVSLRNYRVFTLLMHHPTSRRLHAFPVRLAGDYFLTQYFGLTDTFFRILAILTVVVVSQFGNIFDNQMAGTCIRVKGLWVLPPNHPSEVKTIAVVVSTLCYACQWCRGIICHCYVDSLCPNC